MYKILQTDQPPARPTNQPTDKLIPVYPHKINFGGIIINVFENYFFIEIKAILVGYRTYSFLVCFNFQVLQCCSKLVKMLTLCQTTWIPVRRRVNRRLVWIQAVCIGHYSFEL